MYRNLHEYFPGKKKFVGGNYSTKRFNSIGFSTEGIVEYEHCPLDHWCQVDKDKGELKCSQYGYTYKKGEVPSNKTENIFFT